MLYFTQRDEGRISGEALKQAVIFSKRETSRLLWKQDKIVWQGLLLQLLDGFLVGSTVQPFMPSSMSRLCPPLFAVFSFFFPPFFPPLLALCVSISIEPWITFAQVEIDLNSGIFITMNPAGKGYGGRQKLPDNLKQLFRPVAMSRPDNELIAETIMFSEGFKEAKILGRKLVAIFNLSK